MKNEQTKLEMVLAQGKEKEKGIKVINVQSTMPVEDTFGMPKMKGTDEA